MRIDTPPVIPHAPAFEKSGRVLSRAAVLTRLLLRVPLALLPAFFVNASGSPAFEGPLPGAGSAGSGGARLASRGPAAVFSDPCGIGEAGTPALFCSCTLPYGIRELAATAASLVVPVRWGRCGAGFMSTGGAAYRESTACAAWSGSDPRGNRFGIRVRLLYLAIPRYGSWTGAAADFYLRLRLDETWSFGGSIENVNGASPDRRGPSGLILNAGLRFEPAPGWRLVAEAGQAEGRPGERRFGAEAAVIPGFVLRAGWTTGPSTAAFGAGFRRGKLEADYACSAHPALGLTHRTDITIFARAGR
ncbi:MAG: hypothetical protein QUS35_03060 [bacterium]|nr:hypothetical protein [bacterium]